ncbi:hypothetical protein BKA93DRAFT_816487 [Sparassis latifolia]
MLSSQATYPTSTNVVESPKLVAAFTALLQEQAQGGDSFTVPLTYSRDGGVISEVYTNLGMDERVQLMVCCNGIARCMAKLQHREEVRIIVGNHHIIDQIDVLYKNARFAAKPALFEWAVYHPQPQRLDFHLQRITGLVGASDMFLALGNTGSATHCRVVSAEAIRALTGLTETRPLRAILPSGSVNSLTQFRHPDPELHSDHRLSDESLQVRGSWQKIKLPWNIKSRIAFASIIWKSRTYIVGGQRSGTFEVYNDAWCLDLTKLDGWRQLPPYPGRCLMHTEMAVHGNKAYAFTGRATIEQIRTTFVGANGHSAPWPYAENDVDECAVHIVRGRISCMLGINCFMVLDLATKRWEKLSGTTGEPIADSTCPGPRKRLASWVDARGEKIYFMYGMADRAASQMFHQPHPAQASHGYDDLWSWDIQQGKWYRERLVGNTPCPRAELSHAFNPQLNSAFIFGGYSPELPTLFATSGICFGFSYYADTFMLDYSSPTPKWKHVLTRGFPTYRAQATLLTDPDTGRMFLFGGYTNTDWVPSGEHERTRSFGDVWQFRVDVPRGFFEEVDMDDEERTALVGPWQKCFSCGSIGPWKKCGGEYMQRASVFLRPQGLKDGWPEHRRMHDCARA